MKRLEAQDKHVRSSRRSPESGLLSRSGSDNTWSRHNSPPLGVKQIKFPERSRPELGEDVGARDEGDCAAFRHRQVSGPCPDKVALNCVLLTFLIQVDIFAAHSRMRSLCGRNDGVKVKSRPIYLVLLILNGTEKEKKRKIALRWRQMAQGPA